MRIASPGIVVRRVRGFRRATGAILGGCTVLVAALSVSAGQGIPTAASAWLWLAGLFGALVSAGTLGSSYMFHDPTLATARSRGRAGAIEIGESEIVVEVDGEARRWAKGRIASGWMEPLGDGHAAVLRSTEGDLISVRVEDAAEADALLRAAGVSAERQALRIKLPSRAEQQPAGRLTGVVQLLALALFALPCLAAFVWVGWEILFGRGDVAPLLAIVGAAMATSSFLLYRIVRFLASPSVIVGADGIAIQSGRSRRFIPYRRVAAVQKYPLGVRLRTRDGKSVLLPTWTTASGGKALRRGAEIDEARRDVLYDRIQSAMLSGGGDLADVELALLDRGGRTLERWRDDLGRLLDRARYREVGLDRSVLEQVLSDPAATPARRVAAAFALSTAKDDAVRDRARVATEACADERLRFAIARAAAGELDEGVDGLDADPAPMRRAL